MTDFRQQYKEKAFGFGNASEGRVLRAEKRVESQKNQRAKVFNRNRNITETSNTPHRKGTQENRRAEDRTTKLAKWKADRDKRKKMEVAKKKPPFKVGIVHHRVYSPINKDASILQTSTREKVHIKAENVSCASKRITRATEKRLKAKAAAIKKPSVKKELNVSKVHRKQEESFAPANYKFKAPVGLQQMPLFGRVPQRASTNQIKNFFLSPQKTSRLSIRKSMTPFTVENIYPKKEVIKQEQHSEEEEPSLHINNVNKKKLVNNSDLSIEAVTLRLSSEEEDSGNSPKGNKLTENCVALNTSYTISADNIDDKPNSGESKELNTTLEVEKKECPGEPVFFSPYVVASRGKNNARKEQQSRRGIGRSPSNDIPTKETVMQNLNISIEEEERTAQYFRFILNKEIERLNELCDKWVKIQEETDTTEDGKYQINQAIGQTNLLTNKKFERFRGLVYDCETGKGEMLVTCKDLQGFWDMMYMEVKDCDSRFEKLEKLRSNNWQEEQPAIVNAVTKKKGVKKKKVVSTKQSSLKALILAAREKKLTGKIENTDDSNKDTDKNLLSTDVKSKAEAKANNRRSKSLGFGELKLTPSKLKNTRMSLLQKVQLSNTNKRLSSPLAVIKISQMCKTPQVHLDDTISYVNSDQTPAKSILKRTSESASCTKSTHKVNFNDSVVLNEVPVDEETKTKLDLSAALARIDNYNLDDPSEVHAKVERKLNFDEDSSDENLPRNSDDSKNDSKDEDSELENKNKHMIPMIQVLSATPSLKPAPINELNTSLPKKASTEHALNLITKLVTVSLVDVMGSLPPASPESTKSGESEEKSKEPEMNDTLNTVRILRSRTISAMDTPKATPKKSSKVSTSAEESEQKENKTPSKSRRASSSKRTTNKESKGNNMSLEDAIDKISLDDNSDKRRRSRKSVKFLNAEQECVGCVSGKEVLPMTPHIRRSRSHRSESRKSVITEDLISWETPEKPLARISRSQSKKQ